MSKATDAMRTVNVKHGHARQGAFTPEYRAWAGMKARCYNTQNTRYVDYGGRGIRVCREWLRSFPTFLAAVGLRPSPRHSIDRKDNDGDYTPDNVQWSTRLVQSRNRRNRRLITVYATTKPAWEWSLETGIRVGLICQRLRKGWSPERAVYTGRRHDQPRCKRGHLLSGENVRITSTGSRCCMTCKHANDAAYRAARRKVA